MDNDNESLVRYGGHMATKSTIPLSTLIEDCLEMKWHTVQIFFGNNISNTNRRNPKEQELSDAAKICKKNNFILYTHFPYTLNLVKPHSKDTLKGLQNELERVGKIGGRVIIHPNSPTIKDGQKNVVSKQVYIGGHGSLLKNIGCCEILEDKYGKKCAKVCDSWVSQYHEAIDVMISNLKLLKFPKTVEYPLLLELSSGEGQKLGSTIEEMETIVEKLGNLPIGFCIDTCHVFARGTCKFDTYDNVVKFFEDMYNKNILDRVKAIHLNDSMDEFFSMKDRHEPVGYGTIWSNKKNLEGLETLAEFCKLYHIDVIFETVSVYDPTLKIGQKLFASD